MVGVNVFLLEISAASGIWMLGGLRCVGLPGQILDFGVYNCGSCCDATERMDFCAVAQDDLIVYWSAGNRTWYRAAPWGSLLGTGLSSGLFWIFVGFWMTSKISLHFANFRFFRSFTEFPWFCQILDFYTRGAAASVLWRYWNAVDDAKRLNPITCNITETIIPAHYNLRTWTRLWRRWVNKCPSYIAGRERPT